ncbi:hypothetical protein T261_2246 [Streptomyces lydicus]|nr:hypothetical protein T261_2246 [Streptomyces lydicus]
MPGSGGDHVSRSLQRRLRGRHVVGFAAHVIATTGADLVACLVGAAGALSGPLGGGSRPGARHA